MNDVIDGKTGEIVSVGAEGVSAIVRAEIDMQIATAKRFGRAEPHKIAKKITDFATLDEETASECLYAFVRGKKQQNRNDQAEDRENKPIEGPSIRLAEIAAQCFGNCRIQARVVQVNRSEKYVEAEGVFLDLESNTASSATVRRRISTKSGYPFSDDMINVTANAACAIAKRNAILAGIPRGLYRPAYLAARGIVAGTAETLSANREKAIKAFAAFGVKPVQLFEALKVEGETDIKTEHIVTLRSMFATLKNEEATVEEMFAKPEPEHRVVQNPLGDGKPESAGEGGSESAGAATSNATDGGGDRKPASEEAPAQTEQKGSATEKVDGKSTGAAAGKEPEKKPTEKQAVDGNLCVSFHEALSGYTQKNSLTKGINKFWESHIKPDAGTPEADALEVIQGLHTRRVEQGLDLKDIAEDVKEAIV